MEFAQNNRLFDLARNGKLRLPRVLKRIYPLLAILYSLIAPLVTSILISVPLVLVLLFTGMADGGVEVLFGSSAGMALLLLVGFAPIFFLVWAWLFLFEQRHLWTVGLESSGWLSKYLRGILWGVIMIGAAIAIPAMLGYIQYENVNSGYTAALASVLIVLPGWIVQGAAEEVLFRGFLFQILGIRWGVRVAILISALLFAFMHVFNQNIDILPFINLFLFGVFACVYGLREGSLWGIFALHSAWNWAQSSFFGMEVSGLPVRLGTLINLTETGPDWLTGGAFGPEGGVAVTLVLLVGIALILFVRGSLPQGDKS